MTFSLPELLSLARFTLQSPREGARAVIALDPPVEARWLVLVLMAVGSALLTTLSLILMPAALRDAMSMRLPSPLVSAGLQVLVLAVAVNAIHHLGRMRGGTGRFADALLLIGWLQFILLCVQVVQLAAQVILPVMADLIGLMGIALFFWLLTNFVAELHGFRSLGAVFLGILGAIVVLAMLIAIFVMPFMGPTMPGI